MSSDVGGLVCPCAEQDGCAEHYANCTTHRTNDVVTRTCARAADGYYVEAGRAVACQGVANAAAVTCQSGEKSSATCLPGFFRTIVPHNRTSSDTCLSECYVENDLSTRHCGCRCRCCCCDCPQTHSVHLFVDTACQQQAGCDSGAVSSECISQAGSVPSTCASALQPDRLLRCERPAAGHFLSSDTPGLVCPCKRQLGCAQHYTECDGRREEDLEDMDYVRCARAEEGFYSDASRVYACVDVPNAINVTCETGERSDVCEECCQDGFFHTTSSPNAPDESDSCSRTHATAGPAHNSVAACKLLQHKQLHVHPSIVVADASSRFAWIQNARKPSPTRWVYHVQLRLELRERPMGAISGSTWSTTVHLHPRLATAAKVRTAAVSSLCFPPLCYANGETGCCIV